MPDIGYEAQGSLAQRVAEAVAQYGPTTNPVASQMAADYNASMAGVGIGAGAGVFDGSGLMGQPVPASPLPIAALPAAIAAVPPLLGALGVGAGTVATIAGVAGAGYGLLQAFGLGEGGGLFGNNLLGGDDFNLGGIQFGGPGLAEPAANQIIKEWHVNYDWGRLQYYLVQMPSGGRKIALYNTRTKRWKVWPFRTPRLAVIGKNMPSHKMIVRLRTNLKKHSADARTILKMTSPASLAQSKRRRR